MKWICVLFLMLIISVSLTYGGSLRGTVRDAQSLNPIVDVHVDVGVFNPADSIGLFTTTDQKGEYSITGIPLGSMFYTVTMHKDGYINYFAFIDNLGSIDLIYDVALTLQYIPPEPEPLPPSDSSTVSGNIMTPSAGSGVLIPVANAQIKFASGSRRFDAMTDSDGKYSTEIPLGLYSVDIIAEGYNNLTITKILIESASAAVNAVLQSAGTGVDPDQTLVNKFTLMDAYPNPCNPSARIDYDLKEAGFVSMRVYNLVGQEVAILVDGVEDAGHKSVNFNTGNLATGVYFYRLQAGNFSQTKRLILLK